MNTIKEKLFNHCQQQVYDKIAVLEQSIRDYQDAANEDSKSSMGDKYETNRAMMHLEKEKAATQLGQLQKMRQLLDTIKIDKKTDQAAIGSLVTTEKGRYFLSIGLGPIEFEDQQYFVISAASPIGQAMVGKKAGEFVEFRGGRDMIVSIE